MVQTSTFLLHFHICADFLGLEFPKSRPRDKVLVACGCLESGQERNKTQMKHVLVRKDSYPQSILCRTDPGNIGRLVTYPLTPLVGCNPPLFRTVFESTEQTPWYQKKSLGEEEEKHGQERGQLWDWDCGYTVAQIKEESV